MLWTCCLCTGGILGERMYKHGGVRQLQATQAQVSWKVLPTSVPSRGATGVLAQKAHCEACGDQNACSQSVTSPTSCGSSCINSHARSCQE